MRIRVITGLMLAAVCVQADPLPEQDRLQFADGLYSRDMFALAAQEYEAFLRDFPASAEAPAAAFRLAECYRRTGDRSAAEKQLARIFTRYPDSPYAFKAGYRRACIFQEAGQTNAAVDLFRALLDRKPPPDLAAAARYSLGDLLLQMGRTSDAQTVLEDLIREHPESPFTAYGRLKLAELAVSEGPQPPDAARVARALSHLRAAEGVAPSDRVRAEILFQTADLYFRAGDYTNSSALFLKLAQTFPSDRRVAESRLQAAWAAHNAGRFADALRLADDALRESARSAERPDWLYLKANCERQLLQHAAALQTYDRLLSEHGSHRLAGAARYEKALTALRSGRHREAIEEALRIQASGEMQKNVYWLLAQAHEALSENDRAVQYYRLILRDFPKSDVAPDAAYRLGHRLQQQGENEEASRYFLSVASQWPDHPLAPQALYASAVSLARADRPAEAVRDWDAMLRRYGQHPLAAEAPYYKALSEMRSGAPEAALRSLEDFVKRQPGSKLRANALFWQALLLRDAGQTRHAEESLRSALQSGPDAELLTEIRFHLATLLQARGQHDESAALFQTLLGTDVEARLDPALLEWLALYWLGKGDATRAATAALTLAGRAPDSARRQTGWALGGRALLKAGKAAEAEAAFRKCLDIDARTPHAAEAALHLADLAFGADRHSEALDLYRRAAELAGDEPGVGIRARAYAGLGQSAKALGRPIEAARYFMSVAILYEDADVVPLCLYEAAHCFATAGDAASAAASWKELQTRYPNSPWAAKPPPIPPAQSSGGQGGGPTSTDPSPSAGERAARTR